MEKIASFTIDHLRLLPGLYVSRRDERGGVAVTTFDLRVCAPNREPVMDMPALHTIEHLGATYLRNSEGKEDVVYFGPMGCQTGFYLLVRNSCDNETLGVVISTLEKITAHDGAVPGAKREECGNYKNLDLESAKTEAKRYLDVLRSRSWDFKYPEA